MNARDYVKNSKKVVFVLDEMVKEDRDILMDAIDKMNARREFKDRKELSPYISKMHGVNTSEIHYVKVPENHVTIDFDIKDSDGNKKKSYHEIVRTRYIERNRPIDSRIKNVIWNCPATIVFWTDGTKTVVKAQGNDSFDPEKGLVMAIAKKAMGNKGNYYNEIKKWLDECQYDEKLYTFDDLEKFCKERLNDIGNSIGYAAKVASESFKKIGDATKNYNDDEHYTGDYE